MKEIYYILEGTAIRNCFYVVFSFSVLLKKYIALCLLRLF